MTHTQDTNEITPFYLRFLDEIIPGKVWGFRNSALLSLQEASDKVAKFMDMLEDKDEFLRFFSRIKGVEEMTFQLTDGRVLKCISRGDIGYFFDITDQVQTQSQISSIVKATEECIRDHISVADAINVVKRTIRFEREETCH